MSIDWSAISIIFATLLGPILAVWASEIRQQRKQDRDRREWVFRTLWTTRSTRLNLDHIQALNHIDFAFPQAQFPEIADAWGLYYAHLNTPRGDTKENIDRWVDKGENLLADLIHLMAKELNVPFSKTQVKQPSYYPEHFASTELEQEELRKLLIQVLKSERPLSIKTISNSPY